MKHLKVTMPDGSQYAVPVSVIHSSIKANYREHICCGDLSDESTREWAQNNMNWSDVQSVAVMVCPAPPLSDDGKQEGWVNGKREIVEL